MVTKTTSTRRHVAIVALVGVCLILSVGGCADGEPPTKQVLSDCPPPPPPVTNYPAAGLQGITLKVDTECKFQIDLGASDRLMWEEYVGPNQMAYVRMKIWINPNGTVTRVYDEHDGGESRHLTPLHNTVAKWVYRGGCMFGELKLMFVGKGNRLYIDRSKLQIAPGFEYCNIIRGLRLHAIFKGKGFKAVDTTLSW